MSNPTVRVVNVVPNIKVKRELSDDDEDSVACKICSKSFASEVALNNHARMEHIDVFATGDSSAWTQPKIQFVSEAEEIKLKTEKILSSMVPTELTSLASEDVSYIIIKADPAKHKRKRTKMSGELEKPDKNVGKKQDPQPITGPFECLQPSTLVSEGTCHQIFFSCCAYSIHYRDEHTRRRKGLRCQVCEKPLLGEGEQARAPYTCDVCGAGYDSSKDLSEHMARQHVKLKPFECSVCHKRFTQQGGVIQHMRMHTGDRPFPCTFCNKAFTQKSGLDQHLRIHTKVKPYRCVICSKTFCQSVHLKQHMRTHTNVSPFQCGICQKRFKQSSHLNYHLKNHNPFNMTDEQREVYNNLMQTMNEDSKKVILHRGEDYVEVNLDETEHQEVVLEEDEQIMAEQSIQVNQLEEGEETYILGDNEVWSVKMVEN